MNTLEIDIETYSSRDLKKCGVYAYAESSDFEILLFAYKKDEEETKVIDLASGEVLPEEILDALYDESITKWAFNSQFERVCLSMYLAKHDKDRFKKLRRKYLSPISWKCTMTWSAYLGLPLSLDGVGKVLNLGEQKMKEGKDLIRYFSVPCKATKSNGMRVRNYYYHDKSKWEKFKAYNVRDVDVEAAIKHKLRNHEVPEKIWQEFYLDQEINDRGILVDEIFVDKAIKLNDIIKDKLMDEMRELTSLDNPNSVSQLKGWLESRNVEVDSLDKKAVKKLMEEVSDTEKEVLRKRSMISKSSVKKYEAMQSSKCADNRARGMFRFYGANRSGRWAGRIVQLQNLPQNHMGDLESARELIKSGNFEMIDLLYNNISDVLSQLIRTAFIPRENMKFIVADFSAIEARVLSYLAKEKWRNHVFEKGDDIYCMSASQMFGVPVEKHGVNAHLRQKGKIAELACIAEGEMVLTNEGLVPIESVTKDMKLWDGYSWVSHEGVIYKGEGEVIEYEGLRATKDHIVWVREKRCPITLSKAKRMGYHLLQTGDGRREIRLGEDYKSRKIVEQEKKSLLCALRVSRMWEDKMDSQIQSYIRKIKRMSTLFPTTPCSKLAYEKTHCSKIKMRKHQRSCISPIWRKRNKFFIQKPIGSRTLFNRDVWNTVKGASNRQNRQQWTLCKRKSEICYKKRKLCKSKNHSFIQFFSTVLALCKKCCNKKAFTRIKQGRNYLRCEKSSTRKKKELDTNISKTRLYDIRNAGEHHRFTVSNKLVHNCGYGGSVGALTAMGALEMGLSEEELQPLVDAWRKANSHIVDFWWSVDRAVKDAIKMRNKMRVDNITFKYQSGMLFITLPSGRTLAYVKPKICENKFGGEGVSYEGIGADKKWQRIESYGPKFVENIVQAISRDLLSHAMENLRHYKIVAHVHDEVILEVDKEIKVSEITEMMSKSPSWMRGILLSADGYECSFYKKD